MRKRFLTSAAFAGTALLLAGCAGFSPDAGMSVPAALVRHELGKDVVAIRNEEDAAQMRAAVVKLLKRQLTADSAVQIALLNNRGLQAAYNELGIAEAVRVRQSLPPNPVVAITRISGSAETEIDREIVGNILALATLPIRSDIAKDRFHQAQLKAALDTVRVAADTRRAFYRTVAARELVALLTQAQSAAATAARLAKRLGETGAMNKLDQARELAFNAELTAQLARAKQRAESERERLIRALGLWGGDLSFKLPAKLPALPARARALPAIEQDAVSRRVDLQIARIELETLAKSYGLTKATRFINVLEGGYADKITRTDETVRERGFTVTFEVPLFDFGEARVREAEAIYMQAMNRLAEKAINVRSQAREAYRTYRASYDIARQYQREVLPLRQIISDELTLHYGAMQIDVFALLNEARQKIAANAAAVDALREFWLASADLGTAVIGGGEAATGGSETVATSMPASGGEGGH